MELVRPATSEDVEALFELISKSTYGLTTLKISKEQLHERVEQSEFAFSRKFKKPSGQPYVFVMEDLSDGKLIGTCSIYSKVGGYEPFYSYRIETSIHQSESLGIRKEIKVLHLRKEHNGPTEIGSLFLDSDYRGNGRGRLLSMSRFLFLAHFPERFDTEVIAEMRGRVDDQGLSAFWDAIGSHFFDLEFPKAEILTTVSKNFIADLMPAHPIYIPLLPKTAQETIGKVHPQTEPALAMLQREGFEHRDLVDIFDGGPVMHCDTTMIRAVRESRVATVGEIVEQVEGDPLLISSVNDDDFRVCLGGIKLNDEGKAIISRVTALTLQIRLGEPTRFVELRPPNPCEETEITDIDSESTETKFTNPLDNA